MSYLSKQDRKKKIHRRVRKKVTGTTDKPRLAVQKTGKNIYAQVIDDQKAVTLVFASSLSKELKLLHGANCSAAEAVGQMVAKKAKEAGIKEVVFDRGGNLYHGRIQVLAEAARAEGLIF